MSESDTFLLGFVLYMNLGALFITLVFAFGMPEKPQYPLIIMFTSIGISFLLLSFA